MRLGQEGALSARPRRHLAPNSGGEEPASHPAAVPGSGAGDRQPEGRRPPTSRPPSGPEPLGEQRSPAGEWGTGAGRLGLGRGPRAGAGGKGPRAGGVRAREEGVGARPVGANAVRRFPSARYLRPKYGHRKVGARPFLGEQESESLGKLHFPTRFPKKGA